MDCVFVCVLCVAVIDLCVVVGMMYARSVAVRDSTKRERPYQHDSTASRLLSEVKHVWAWLVLRWGTTLESQVLFSFCNIILLNSTQNYFS